MSLFAELKRRNVFRMAVLYVVAAWVVMQVAGVLMELGALSSAVGPWILAGLVIGFPIALVFSWLFEITPEGLALEKDVPEGASITHITGRRMDFIVIAVLSAGLILLAYDKWWIPAPADTSLAVMPFVNMSNDSDNEYFCDGVSEEIINLLRRVPGLTVISRSSAFSFKGKDVDIPTIAEKLNVAHVLEGSVRKSGNHLRITVQLIEVATDTHLWSETYDRELQDIFDIQDEIAAAVVDELKITLLGEIPKSTVTNPEAYALYLQAQYLYDNIDRDQAETMLKQALTIDPGFAPAWAQLGYVYLDQIAFGYRPYDDESYVLVRNTIQKALDLDPQNGVALATLGHLESHATGDFKAAEQLILRAMALNPGDTYVLSQAAHLDRILGRLDSSIDLYEQIAVLDPISIRAHRDLVFAYFAAHRLEDAASEIQLIEALIQRRPHRLLASLLLEKGDVPAAMVETEQITVEWLRLYMTAIVQFALGDIEASNAALDEFIDKYQEGRDSEVARIYAIRGEIDLAFKWLGRAYNARDFGLVTLLLDPGFANLHDDPRWEPFLDKMGLPY